MEPESSELEVLVNLGLTLVQARVYLALVKSGPSRVAVIAKISRVARPDVYLTLSKLGKLGLVEKIIKRPLEYRAIPMDKGLSLLLKTKTEEYKKVTAEAQLLLHRAKKQKPDEKKHVVTPQFVIIPKGENILERIKTAIERAQLSIDHVLSWKRFSRGMVSDFAESMEIAWAKKVKTRFIIESPLESETAKQLVQYCREKPFCQIKFIPFCPSTVFAIFDKKEASIIVFSKTDLPGSPTLWTSNSSLIALATDHFEMLWRIARKQPS